MATTGKPRKSRAAPRYPLRAVPFAFWNVLFPEIPASFETTITGWIVAGMHRGKFEEKLDAVLLANRDFPTDWFIRVDDKSVALSFPNLSQVPEFRRPLLLKPDFITVPSFKVKHPIEQLKALPDSGQAQDNVRNLFLLTVSEIDRIIRTALKSAINRGDFIVTGIPAGNPFAARSQIRLAEDRRPFNLDIENNRIHFGHDTPDLTAIEVSRVASEPGKAKSLAEADALFVEQLKAMRDKDPGFRLIAATEKLAPELAGKGTEKSKADRLRRRFSSENKDLKRTRS